MLLMRKLIVLAGGSCAARSKAEQPYPWGLEFHRSTQTTRLRHHLYAGETELVLLHTCKHVKLWLGGERRPTHVIHAVCAFYMALVTYTGCFLDFH